MYILTKFLCFNVFFFLTAVTVAAAVEAAFLHSHEFYFTSHSYHKSFIFIYFLWISIISPLTKREHFYSISYIVRHDLKRRTLPILPLSYKYYFNNLSFMEKINYNQWHGWMCGYIEQKRRRRRQEGINDVLGVRKLWHEFFRYLIIIEKMITLLTFYGRVVKFNNWYIFDFFIFDISFFSFNLSWVNF